MEKLTFIKNNFLNFVYNASNILGINNRAVSVICYHSISDGENKYSVSKSQFQKEIDNLRMHYNFIPLEDVLNLNKKTKASVALTFDDGYKDILKVVPYLKKNNIPAALFVMSEPENVDRRELDHQGELLSTNQIKQLHSQGWVIGCHSATHGDFKNLSSKEVEKEIINSKKKLEERLGFKVDHFAYPKGIFNQTIINAVKKAGYKGAFAAFPGTFNLRSNKYVIPRFVMESDPAVYAGMASFAYSTDLFRKVLGLFNAGQYLKVKNYEI